ncbi:hypothetical protein FF098_002490 [Parvularcula flava]|uniref:Lipoprotein n=1 Tax=Aquisalinus luteolus TaxID=1566827 RepID=A0ABX0HGW4_9PROT|nr:hypothetical protein [Aquisalinus luteolus]
MSSRLKFAGLCAVAALATGCATQPASPETASSLQASTTRASASPTSEEQKKEQDRAAILAMAGDYKVSFDFTETVPFVAGYELKEPKLSGGHEVVRVIRNDEDFISLQHILVVGGEQKFPIKHWRQDWIYEPASIPEYVGGNAWQKREFSAAERDGKWAQLVYQVDDGPRYGALAEWTHENGVSSWTSPPNMRPLPRRDATTRDDYDAILATNRHAITPNGWVHEQDNSKLILRNGEPQVLAREVGINTYNKYDDFDVGIADDYWAATAEYWAIVRDAWTALEQDFDAFGLTVQGEPEALYMPLLNLAGEVEEGTLSVAEAGAQAEALIEEYTTTQIGTVKERLAEVGKEDGTASY